MGHLLEPPYFEDGKSKVFYEMFFGRSRTRDEGDYVHFYLDVHADATFVNTRESVFNAMQSLYEANGCTLVHEKGIGNV